MAETEPVAPRRPSPLGSLAGAFAVSALDVLLLASALGGLQALLHHTRAITLLAVWLAGGMALSLARPVRSHDPLDLKRESPLLLIGLLVVPIAVAPLSAWAEHSGLWLLPGGAWLRWRRRPPTRNRRIHDRHRGPACFAFN